MTIRAKALALLACAALTVGCSPKTPDYQSIWTTSNSAAAEVAPEDAIPLEEYLEKQDITVEPVAPATLTDLTVSIPTPAGWSKLESDKVPPTTTVIGKGEMFPSAIMTVSKLSGDFEPAELVKHGFADAELSPNFHRLDSSAADFEGFPSAMIQGSHDMNGQRVRSWFRMVVATGSQPSDQRYLVQLTIITLADHAAAQAGDVETIIDGFTVKAK